jgi:hypothetical protein
LTSEALAKEVFDQSFSYAKCYKNIIEMKKSNVRGTRLAFAHDPKAGSTGEKAGRSWPSGKKHLFTMPFEYFLARKSIKQQIQTISTK